MSDLFNKNLFRKPKNELETGVKQLPEQSVSIPEQLFSACAACKKSFPRAEINDSFGVCPGCGHSFKIGARARLDMLVDKKSFIELDRALTSTNIIAFPDYDQKLESARKDSRESEGVITGTCRICGFECAVFVMDPRFIMGSMGRIVGEKITRLFEHATDLWLPVIGYTVSGGARMQEGILSLMQMAKVSGAVKRHSDAGLFYTVVLTNPTTGGVTASFAMQADVILAEPKALIGFAGPRVIEKTIKQKLPPDFQKAEYLLDHGFIDEIVPRADQRAYLTRLLKLHA